MQKYSVTINSGEVIPIWAYAPEAAISRATLVYEYVFGPDRMPVESVTVHLADTEEQQAA